MCIILSVSIIVEYFKCNMFVLDEDDWPGQHVMFVYDMEGEQTVRFNTSSCCMMLTIEISSMQQFVW